MTTSESELIEETYSPIEYAQIDYRNLPSRRVQPTGHSKIYFLPNPKILPEQYKTFVNAKKILDSVKQIPSINVIEFEQTNKIFKILKEMISQYNWCRKIPRQFIQETLIQNDGIIYISRNVIGMDVDDELLAFSTIKLVNDNRYKMSGHRKGYLEIDLLCANSLYKHMGTQILDILVDIAVKLNCSHIHLEALDDVVDFYKKFGFTEEVNPVSKKEKGVTSMDFKILSDQEYKASSKYKENYGSIQGVAWGKKKKTNKNRKNKKRPHKTRRSKSRKV
jgi:hypothetical protein